MNTPRSAMLALLALAACNRSAPEPAPRPAPRPTPAAPSTVTLRREWSTVVVMERDDSIVLTLPDGNRQTQRQTRTARFTMTSRATRDRARLKPTAVAPTRDVERSCPLVDPAHEHIAVRFGW